MCGRFAFFSPREAVQAAFGVDIAAFAEQRYNIAPGQDVTQLHLDGTGRLIADRARWGLVPFWAKDPAIGNRMINARAETIAEKPAYRQAFARRRCIVLGSGFYEWHTDESGKWPWFISRSDGDVFGLAGLWEIWESGDGEPLQSCTIITAPANEYMSRLHHRMPVIMDRAAAHAWLDPDASTEQRADMLLSTQTTQLQAWKVSRKVNSPINDSAELIEARTG